MNPTYSTYRQWHQDYYQRNNIKYREYAKAYYKQNRDLILEKAKERYRNKKINFNSYEIGKKKVINFTINFDE